VDVSEQDRAPVRRPISITSIVDCVGSLATGTLHENLYLLDSNRAGGSTGQGTPALRTRVSRGDRLLWTVITLECEAFAAIEDIRIDTGVCRPERHTYPDSDVAYWTATVARDDIGLVPYEITFRIGPGEASMTTPVPPALIGGTSPD